MWADALLALERGHLLRVNLWGAGSVLLGTLVLVLVIWKQLKAPLLRHFAIQLVVWGAARLAMGAFGWSGLGQRDYTGAQRLVSWLWLNVGLDAGYVMLGATLVGASWRLGQNQPGMGAGAAIVVQGLVFLLLDVRLLSLIGPLQ